MKEKRIIKIIWILPIIMVISVFAFTYLTCTKTYVPDKKQIGEYDTIPLLNANTTVDGTIPVVDFNTNDNNTATEYSVNESIPFQTCVSIPLKFYGYWTTESHLVPKFLGSNTYLKKDNLILTTLI